jgi:hypothetical protein
MVVHIFAGCYLGGLWQSGSNGFLPCRFFLYLVLVKRCDYFLVLFLDSANITGKFECCPTRARGLRNPPFGSLKHNRFMLHVSPHPKATVTPLSKNTLDKARVCPAMV